MYTRKAGQAGKSLYCRDTGRKDGRRPFRVLAAFCLRGYNLAVANVARQIRVAVLFFGRLKEIVGRAEESMECDEGASVEDLFAQYVARYPELAKYRTSLVASCNQEFVAWDAPVRSGDEVAFLPPVSGG
jgi:molybdopterin synthase sulfur carrier subunit